MATRTTESLDKTIRDWLYGQGRSQRDWALALGITPAYLTQIMAGDRMPALPLALRMARETGIAIDRFIPSDGDHIATLTADADRPRVA